MAEKLQKKVKELLSQKIELPSGVSCSVENREIILKKGPVSLARKISEPEITASVSGSELVLTSSISGKRAFKVLRSYVAHIKNILLGLDAVFSYKLEMCNVHFPMTLKVEKDKVAINNFLGEKTPRHAVILPKVNVEVKGSQITVTSNDREAAGQTAANLERATKVRNRDRRVFQDGIYITEKAGRKI